MTAEVVFAKTFLSVLDTKPVKLQSDYAADARSLEITFPYTLPRNNNAKPMVRKPKADGLSKDATAGAAPGSEAAVSVSLKSIKNPSLDLTLPAEAISTSVLDLKQRVAQEVGLDSIDKVRLLWKKKPVGDAKTLKEIIGEEGLKSLEFSVMVIGGVPEKRDASTADLETGPVAQGESGAEVLGSEEFWSDLHGFLEQRIRSSETAEKATRLFKEAWQKGGS